MWVAFVGFIATLSSSSKIKMVDRSGATDLSNQLPLSASLLSVLRA